MDVSSGLIYCGQSQHLKLLLTVDVEAAAEAESVEVDGAVRVRDREERDGFDGPGPGVGVGASTCAVSIEAKSGTGRQGRGKVENGVTVYGGRPTHTQRDLLATGQNGGAFPLPVGRGGLWFVSKICRRTEADRERLQLTVTPLMLGADTSPSMTCWNVEGMKKGEKVDERETRSTH